jgi:hypothetical protein
MDKNLCVVVCVWGGVELPEEHALKLRDLQPRVKQHPGFQPAVRVRWPEATAFYILPLWVGSQYRWLGYL